MTHQRGITATVHRRKWVFPHITVIGPRWSPTRKMTLPECREYRKSRRQWRKVKARNKMSKWHIKHKTFFAWKRRLRGIR